MTRDVGDFPTPPGLVALVLDRLGPRWDRVLEPTCGGGRFLQGLLDRSPVPREIQGIELQECHYREASSLAERAPASRTSRVRVRQASLFELDLARDLEWTGTGRLLVVGNPPWVTNAELGGLGSSNLPTKSNFKCDRGIVARTGASNFDIAEAVWLKLLNDLKDQDATIALLCKTSVARRVLEHAHKAKLPVADAEIVRIDARAWFGAAVEACWLRVRLGNRRLERIPVFDRFDRREPVAEMGFVHGRLVADLSAYSTFAFADGTCPLTWRQGLKHDAARVMELSLDRSGTPRNHREEPVDVEPEYVFPLFKGADLARPGPVAPSRAVIVTQRKVGEDTSRLEREAPRLWSYLQANAPLFDRRKSSIYRDGPRFAMFGIGPYSFEPYKVVVSGLHREPRFHAVGPHGGRPSMLDDTSYSLACDSPEQAAVVSALLNSSGPLGLLKALTFPGAKRPVTKAALQRIDLAALLARSDRAAILERAQLDLERLSGRARIDPESLKSLLATNPKR
jgi:hypothetical protein